MLELDESLFVEHEREIGEESAFQIAKAVASFANTLGGWLLIGVQDGKPYGSTGPWVSGEAPTLIDTIRNRLRGEVDPLPAFEARVMRPPGVDAPVGVVRVYESADTPHIVVSTGSVFVREVAGDTDVEKEAAWTDAGDAAVRGDRDPKPCPAHRAGPAWRSGSGPRSRSYGSHGPTTDPRGGSLGSHLRARR